MQDNIKKKTYQEYLSKWQKVKEIEEKELRDASFELLFRQTLSIWDIGRTLDFFTSYPPSEHVWSVFQKKWIDAHARK